VPRFVVVLLALLLTAELATGIGYVAVQQVGGGSIASSFDGVTDRLRPPAEEPIDPAALARAEREEKARAVQAVLDARATALLNRDREGWLAPIDATSTEFRERQAAVFDAMADVPLASWSYEVDATRGSDTTDLPLRYGAKVWVPQVTLSYAFAEFDPRPTIASQVFTFVERDGAWLLAADDDFDDTSVRTSRMLWDYGPVSVVRGERALVLGHPDTRQTMLQVARETDEAVPRVTRVWGEGWVQRVVVLVPQSTEELSLILGEGIDLSNIAAVATAQLLGGPGYYDPVGDRIVVNPPNYTALGEAGRRVVLTHEVTHVASRADSGPALPLWLVEGLADYVGYRESGVAVESAARKIGDEVRSGRVPDRLPTAEDFRGGNPRLAYAYEGAWLAALRIVEAYGEDTLLRLYRQIGAAGPEADAEEVVDTAFQEVLGMSHSAFATDWQVDLKRRFS
jgi:hypothetical protein